MEKSLIIYLPEGFADWEGAFLMPELMQAGKKFFTVSETGKAVRSIGGLNVTPDFSLKDVDISNIEGLILIGSDSWNDPNKNLAVLELAKKVLGQGVLVGAICGATVGLARMEVLNGRPHTSNDLGLLKKLVPDYTGDSFYVQKLAITDKNLITASGIGALEFTREMMTALNLFSENYRTHWFEFFKNAVIPPMEFWAEQQPSK